MSELYTDFFRSSAPFSIHSFSFAVLDPFVFTFFNFVLVSQFFSRVLFISYFFNFYLFIYFINLFILFYLHLVLHASLRE